MSRAKNKRAGTRGGGTNVGKKPRAPLPDDLAEAAEAALDDLLSSSQHAKLDDDDEPGTARAREGKGRGLSTHEVSLDEIIPIDVEDDDADDDPLTRARPRRLPSKVKPLATAAPPPAYKSPSSTLDPSIDATNPVEQSEIEEIDDVEVDLGASPMDDDEPRTAFADRQRGRGPAVADDDDGPPTGFANRQHARGSAVDDDGLPTGFADRQRGRGSAVADDDDGLPTGFADRQRGRGSAVAGDDDEPPTGFADRQHGRGGDDELPSQTSARRTSSPHEAPPGRMATPSGRTSSTHDAQPGRTSSTHDAQSGRTSSPYPAQAPSSLSTPARTSAHTISRGGTPPPATRTPSPIPSPAGRTPSPIPSPAGRTPSPIPSPLPRAPSAILSPQGRASSAVPSPLPPEDTSAHTVARDDATFGPGSSRSSTPPPASRATPTPPPRGSSGRAGLPPPSGSAGSGSSGRTSIPSSSRLPLPAPAESRVHDPDSRVDPETIESTTSREPGKGSHATIDMQNAKHGQLTRETSTSGADARRAYLESAKFERRRDDGADLPSIDSDDEEIPGAADSLDHVDLDSEPFVRSDSAPFARSRDSAPFDRADAARFDRGDSAPFGRSDSAPFDRAPSGPRVHLDDALAGLDAERAPSNIGSGEERALYEVPALRFAVYEDPAYLSSAQNAIVSAGHVIAAAGAGRDALKRVGDLIRTGSIDVVLVSLPGGESIIDAALSVEPRRPTIIASLSASSVEAVSAAALSGADLATTRPHDVERIAPLALAAARIDAERRVAASAKGAEQVLRQRLEDMADAEPGGLLPFEMFQKVLELEIKRAKRFNYPLSVALFAVEIAPPQPPPGILGILRARAGNALINTIRDIDIATQLDHERFLVLLPYTDLKGAASVSKRIIAAVAKGQAVVSDGRTFPPRVVGACAGMKKGEPVSFAKLMKDATRALESARRDGAELAVQP
jgi:hypothetical protein